MVAFLALVQVVRKGAWWNVGELAPRLARFHVVVGSELVPASLLGNTKPGPNMFHVPVRRWLVPPGRFGDVLPGLETHDSLSFVRIG